MTTMTQPDKRQWRKLHSQLRSQRDPNEMLDVLLALDRMLVEVSMRIYKGPPTRPVHHAEAKPAAARCRPTTSAPAYATFSLMSSSVSRPLPVAPHSSRPTTLVLLPLE